MNIFFRHYLEEMLNKLATMSDSSFSPQHLRSEFQDRRKRAERKAQGCSERRWVTNILPDGNSQCMSHHQLWASCGMMAILSGRGGTPQLWWAASFPCWGAFFQRSPVAPAAMLQLGRVSTNSSLCLGNWIKPRVCHSSNLVCHEDHSSWESISGASKPYFQ